VGSKKFDWGRTKPITSTMDNIMYESPGMCWFRTNQEMASARGTKMLPSKSDYKNWLRGCKKFPKQHRKTYLLCREAIDVEDETTRKAVQSMSANDKAEPVLVEVFGDLF